jgi:hypothetical protein
MAEKAIIDTDDSVAEESVRAWRPSIRPSLRGPNTEEGRILEVTEPVGIIGRIGRFAKRPFVKLITGLGIFILAAIVYDATVNFGEWTERKEKPAATKHRGLAPVPKTPDG